MHPPAADTVFAGDCPWRGCIEKNSPTSHLISINFFYTSGVGTIYAFLEVILKTLPTKDKSWDRPK
jgi:hypothetical protein